MAKYSETYDVSEVHGTRREEEQFDSSTITVTLECAWALRGLVVDEIVGGRKLFPDPPTTGQEYRAKSAVIDTVKSSYTTDEDSQIVIYEKANIVVTYSDNIDEDNTVEVIDYNARFLTGNTKNLYLNTEDPPVPDGYKAIRESGAHVGIVVNGEITRTHYNVDTSEIEFWDQFTDNIGSINDFALTTQHGPVFTVNRVLYKGYRPKRRKVADRYTIETKWMWADHDWNQIRNPEAAHATGQPPPYMDIHIKLQTESFIVYTPYPVASLNQVWNGVYIPP